MRGSLIEAPEHDQARSLLGLASNNFKWDEATQAAVCRDAAGAPGPFTGSYPGHEECMRVAYAIQIRVMMGDDETGTRWDD